ncbi:MAG: LCP family protein [Ruminococcus sp.]|nr:LCP family protein [Ruminococcus sp.]
MRKKTGVVLGFIFLGLVAVMGIGVGLFFHYTNLFDRSSDTTINSGAQPFNSSEYVDGEDTIDPVALEAELKKQLGNVQSPITDENVMNILLIGEDIRDTENQDRGNTDVMMIISINHEQGTITLTSLMRDMWVYMEKYNESGKLNSAYWHEGATYLKEVIEDYFGIKIDRHVKVNFRQFIDIVEAVGGLDLEVSYTEARAMMDPLDEQNHYLGYKRETDYIDLEQYGVDPATQSFTWGDEDEPKIKMHLNGNQALSYARIRYDCGDDYGRTMRQRIVIQEVIKKAKDLNFIQLDSLANKVFPEVQTDITDGEFASLLLNAFDYMKYDIQQLRIPADNYYRNQVIANMQVLTPNFQANMAIMKYVIYGDKTNAEDAAEQYEKEIADGTFYENNSLPEVPYYWW